jgi:hypothetical protein
MSALPPRAAQKQSRQYGRYVPPSDFSAQMADLATQIPAFAGCAAGSISDFAEQWNYLAMPVVVPVVVRDFRLPHLLGGKADMANL